MSVRVPFQTAITFTFPDGAVTTANKGGGVEVDLTSAATAGGLLAANNLSDVDSVSQSRTNLGATSVGASVFTAASTSAAQTAIGATSTGQTLFTAANVAAARSAIVANILSEANYFSDVRAATAMVRWYAFGALSGFLSEVIITLDGAIGGGDLALTVDSVTSGVVTPVTFSSTTVPVAGSAAGTTLRFVPTGGNALVTLTAIRVTIAGANTTNVGATIVCKAVY